MVDCIDFCSTLLLQEEVKVGVVGIIVHVMASDFTLLVPLRSPSAYENTKRGHRDHTGLRSASR